MTRRLLCLHGHFYQPPRENPWIEAIEVQDSAEPFHDWNERIAAECYAPNGAARLKGAEDRIVDIVNNYVHLSFNFGPTLLAWLERERPDIHARVVEADQRSAERRGHGNALAQGYSHAILPLASPRDRLTQIRWGIADFRRRFGRVPEGFWLPETAADTPTLEALVAEGIRYTVLSPYQARRVRAPGGEWRDATGARFDPTRPYRVRVGARELVVFFYDGHIARDLAFGDALSSPEALIRRLEGGFDAGRGHDELLTIALDGETLGHHKKGGDEVLAAALRLLARRDDLELVNLGQALDRIAPEWEAEIAEGSSWSCAHGIERWRSDCGCSVGAQPGWTQAWRAPLLAALEALRTALADVFERESAGLLTDPWGARDRYVEVLLEPDRRDVEEILRREAGRPLAPDEGEGAAAPRAAAAGAAHVHELRLVLRGALRDRDGPGDEVCRAGDPARPRRGRRGSRACVRRGARACPLQRARARRRPPRLRDARPPERGVARGRRRAPRDRQLGARHAGGGATVLLPPTASRRGAVRSPVPRRSPSGGCTSRASSRRRRSTRCSAWSTSAPQTSAAASCLTPARPRTQRSSGCSSRSWTRSRSRGSCARSTAPSPGRDYALRDLFLDERRRVAGVLLEGTLRRYEDDYLRVFEDNRRLMEFLREIDSPVPTPLRVAADVTLTRRILDVTGRARSGEVRLADAEVELLAVGGARPSARGALRRRGGAP